MNRSQAQGSLSVSISCCRAKFVLGRDMTLDIARSGCCEIEDTPRLETKETSTHWRHPLQATSTPRLWTYTLQL